MSIAIHTMTELVEITQKLGSHFFSEETVRYFGTTLLPESFRRVTDTTGWFATGEYSANQWLSGTNEDRQYVVRRFEIDAESKSISFDTVMSNIWSRETAKRAAMIGAAAEQADGYEAGKTIALAFAGLS